MSNQSTNGLKRRRLAGNNSSNDKSSKNSSNNRESDTSSMQTNETKTGSSSGNPTPPKKSTFWVRFVATWSMLAVFVCLVWFGGHVGINCLIILLQMMAFQEITVLGAEEEPSKGVPYFFLLNWMIMFTLNWYINGPLFLDNLAIELKREQTVQWLGISQPLLSNVSDQVYLLRNSHGFLSFCALCTIVVSFVMSLKPGYYRYQFKQLGWCISSVIIVICLSSPTMWNVMEGLIWYLVPALLIVTNDVMAYMVGKNFGRTPLIALSPNKTWEGAIGGGVFTVLFALFVTEVVLTSEFLVCPNKGLNLEHPTCDIAPVFRPAERSFPVEIQEILFRFGFNESFMKGWMIADFQFHSMVFAMFAAVIGPFGGFFASGFKRAFKIKDFANTIPGHGGVTDRMDCQILMASFVWIYRKTFIKGVTEIWLQVLAMNERDQLQLYHDLGNHLGMK